MMTSSLNSKKCSTAERLAREVLTAVSIAIAATPLVASTAPEVWASNTPAIQNAQLRKVLRHELEKSHGVSFGALLKQWDQKYGSKAVSPLLELAATRSIQDSERYTALMGAAKLGGSASAPLIQPFLKDTSWMLRAGALRALSALKNPQTAQASLPLLQDPALVVRLEAVETIEKLRPNGATEALLRAIENKDNYHARKAQWIPQRALQALSSLKAREATPRLLPLLDRREDPELRRQAIQTLQQLNGKTTSRNLSLDEQAKQLKKLLAPSATTRMKRRG